jgi:hypothetical protein
VRIPVPSFTAFKILILKMDFWLKQYARRRYTKYAGARYRYMCFKHNNAAKSRPLGSNVDFFLARTRDSMRMPYRNPLY